MLKTFAATAAAVLALAAAVPAQTLHPCDVTNPIIYRTNSNRLRTLKVGFCFARQDADGLEITEPIGFLLQVNGGPDVDLGILVPRTGPNSRGEQYYETAATLLPGVLTVKAYTVWGISPPSTPVTLVIQGGPKGPAAVILKPGG